MSLCLLGVAAVPAAEMAVPNGDFSDAANFGSVGGGAVGDSATGVTIGQGPWTASYEGVAGALPPPTLTIDASGAVIAGLTASGTDGNGGAFDLATGVPLKPFTRYELVVDFDAGGAFSNDFFPHGNGGIALTDGQSELASSLTTGADFSLANVPGTTATFRLRLRHTTGAAVSAQALGIRLFARPQGLAATYVKPTVSFHSVRLDVRSLASEPGGFVPTAGPPVRARQNPSTALLANGKVLIAGGYNFADNAVGNTAELFDPATGVFTEIGTTLTMGRFAASATPLADGRVMLIGGPYHAACEFYDPVAGTFSPGPELAQPRVGNGFTTTLLADGKVLITGGFDYDEDDNDMVLGTVDLFDPASNGFSALADLSTPRSGHTATLLPDGRVLIVGGYNASFGPDPTAELYDPASGTTTLTGSLATGREGATATLLADGTVLVAGGFNAGAGRHLRSAEIYDPASGTFSAAGDMTIPRYAGTAKLLPDGRVLLTASVSPLGPSGAGFASDVAEIYDPATRQFTATETMTEARDYASTILLPDGRVLVTTGFRQDSARFLSNAEVYNPLVPSSVDGPALEHTRAGASATLLPNDKVLVVGGRDDDGAVATAELYDPAGATFGAAASPAWPRAGHTASLLPNGRVLVAGGGAAQAELYDPELDQFTRTGRMAIRRSAHTATVLPDGSVLVVGGRDDDGAALAEAERYDPASGRFAGAGSLADARAGHTATLLADGRVLFVGGGPATAELYDPANGRFEATGSPLHAHADATATLLADGRVLLLGGDGDDAETYDPVTGLFTAMGRLNVARGSHAALLLTDGRVLLAGGAAATELYDPLTGMFTPVAGAFDPRTEIAATLLADGRVLLAGGEAGTGVLAGTTVFDVGLGVAEVARPRIENVAASALVPQASLELAGAGFRGSTRAPNGSIVGSEASGGTANGAGTSATNFPLVLLRHLDSGRQFYVAPDPASPWTDSTFRSRPLDASLPLGQYRSTVIVNGIPSASAAFTVADGGPIGPPDDDTLFADGFDGP